MKVTTAENGIIKLERVFNPILLETESGEKLSICMRDSGFEFTYERNKYSAKGGEIEQVIKKTTGTYSEEDSMTNSDNCPTSCGSNYCDEHGCTDLKEKAVGDPTPPSK